MTVHFWRAHARPLPYPLGYVIGTLRHNGHVPKIAAATVAENREHRRAALHQAAITLLQRNGGFTVGEVAREVGLSRSAVYEYYGSAGELIADVLIDELTAWSDSLVDATRADADPRARVHAWIRGVLDYVIDGRHALLRSAANVHLPPTRRDEVQRLHHSVIAPLVAALADTDSPDPVRDARYVWGVVDTAIHRIEAGECTPHQEILAVMAFTDGALAAALQEN